MYTIRIYSLSILHKICSIRVYYCTIGRQKDFHPLPILHTNTPFSNSHYTTNKIHRNTPKVSLNVESRGLLFLSMTHHDRIPMGHANRILITMFVSWLLSYIQTRHFSSYNYLLKTAH